MTEQVDLETRLRAVLPAMARSAFLKDSGEAVPHGPSSRVRVGVPLIGVAAVATIVGLGALVGTQSRGTDAPGLTGQSEVADTRSPSVARAYSEDEIFRKQTALLEASIRGDVPPVASAGGNLEGTVLQVAVPDATYRSVGPDELKRLYEDLVAMPVTVSIGEAPDEPLMTTIPIPFG